jgi:hypothetical protein
MANTAITTDILKFMSVTSAKKIQAGTNNPSYIKRPKNKWRGFYFKIMIQKVSGFGMRSVLKFFAYKAPDKSFTEIQNDLTGCKIHLKPILKPV